MKKYMIEKMFLSIVLLSSFSKIFATNHNDEV